MLNRVWRSKNQLSLYACTLACLLAPGEVSATAVVYSPAPTTLAGPNRCGAFPSLECGTYADFDATSLNTQYGGKVAPSFQEAFDAWNPGDPGHPDHWSISGVVDPGGTFNVTLAKAQQFNDVTSGGVEIRIELSGLTLPTLGDGDLLVWVQGVNSNFDAQSDDGQTYAYFHMDTREVTGPCVTPEMLCPPAYPYVYSDNHFADAPKDYYYSQGDQAFFEAWTYLAVENSKTKTIRLLDGVHYAFQNYVTAVPEPSTWALLLLGFGGLGAALRRRRQAATVQP